MPMLEKVEAIFFAMRPDLPMPEKTTLPRHALMASTARSKASSSRLHHLEDGPRLFLQHFFPHVVQPAHRASLILFRVSSMAGRSSRATEFGPSHRACAGSSCTSMKTPSTPTATAALARGKMNCRSPADAPPCPSGQLDAVGRVEDDRVAELPHDRECPEIIDQVVVAEDRSPFGDEDARCSLSIPPCLSHTHLVGET